MVTVTGCRLLLVVEDAVEGHLRVRNSVGGVGVDLVAVDDIVATLKRTRYSDKGMPSLAGTRSRLLLKRTRRSLVRYRSLYIHPVGVSFGRHCFEPSAVSIIDLAAAVPYMSRNTFSCSTPA